MSEPFEPAEALADLPVGVVVQGPDAVIRYANHAALDLLGVSRDELLGLTSFDPRWRAVRPDGRDFPGDEHPAPEAIRTRRPVREVLMGIDRPAHGDRVWLTVTAMPRLADDGRVIDCLVTFSDVTLAERRHRTTVDRASGLEAVIAERTEDLSNLVEELRREVAERRLAEERLVARERLQASVLRAMSEGIALHAPDASIQLSNPSASRVLGLTDDQLRGRSPTDPDWGLVREDGTPLPAAEIPSEITRRTGRPVRHRVVGVHQPDGDLRWVSVTTDPVDEVDGQPPYRVVATFTDITDSLATRRALDLARSRFQRVTDAVPGVLFELTEREGRQRVTFLSGRVSEVLGASADTLLGDARGLFGCLAEHARDAVRRAFREGMATGQAVDVDAPADRGEQEGWLRFRAVPTAFDGGERWTGFILDITEERALAERLRRTQRLETSASLAAGVAHNFNNMLAAILPNLELALESAPEALEVPLHDARSAARQAAELVQQLLLAARGERDRSAVVLDVRGTVRDVLGICRRTFDRSIDVVGVLPEAPLSVRGTSSLLQQVWMNLLINARDAVQEVPQARVEVRVARVDDADLGQAVRVVVADNGTGMPPAVLARLGEPFFTTKEVGKGTGLGVPMVYGIVADLGGRVEVRSEEGEGTRFEVLLPLAEPSSEVPAVLPGPSVDIAGRRVLVVDDEPLVRAAMRRALLRFDLDVVVAGSGAEALERLSGVDAVLLDLSMPGMPGQQVLARIREQLPETPIAVVTGHADAREGLSAADAVLRKPVRMGVLRDWLSEALEDRAPRR